MLTRSKKKLQMLSPTSGVSMKKSVSDEIDKGMAITQTPLSHFERSKQRQRDTVGKNEEVHGRYWYNSNYFVWVDTVFSSSDSDCSSPEWKLATLESKPELCYSEKSPQVSEILFSPHSRDINGNESFDRMMNRFDKCSASFDAMQWDLELALEYIESSQKALTDEQFAKQSPCQASSRKVLDPGNRKFSGRKKRSKTIFHDISEELSPQWNLENAKSYHMSTDIDAMFLIEKYPFILEDSANRTNTENQSPLLSPGYIHRCVHELLQRRKLNEEWFNRTRRNPWTKDITYSPLPNEITGKTVLHEIFRIREKAVISLTVSADRKKEPINLVVKYGTTDFDFLLSGCDISSDLFYAVIPRIFSMWNGRLYGLCERIAVTGRAVPRCFAKLALNVGSILDKGKTDILEVAFHFSDHSCLVSASEETSVLDIMSYCCYFLEIPSWTKDINKVQIFLECDMATPLKSDDTYGSVVARFGKVQWFIFYADERFDVDITLQDLQDQSKVSEHQTKWDDGFSNHDSSMSPGLLENGHL